MVHEEFQKKKKEREVFFSSLENWMEKAAFVLWLLGLLPSPSQAPEGCGAMRQSLGLTERTLVITNCKVHLGMAGSITLWIFCIQHLNCPYTVLELSAHCSGRCFSACPDLGLLSNWGGIYHRFLVNGNNKSGNYFQRLTVEQGSAETEQGIVEGNSWTTEKWLRREWA